MSGTVSNTTVAGTPANMVIGPTANSNPAGLIFHDNFINGIPVTSGVVPTLTAASTITTNGNKFVVVTGTTQINTITSTLMPGEFLTIKAGSNGVNFGTNGNVNPGCFLTFPTLNTGQIARLGYDDTLTSGTLYLVDTSAGSCGFSFDGSQKITGVQGSTGTSLLAFNGSASATHLVNLDANGNGVDSGISSASLGVPLGRITSPIENTGGTSPTQLTSATITIPANTVTASGTINVFFAVSACTGAGAPFTDCTAANTGTCTPSVYLGTSATGQNFTLRTVPAINAAKSDIENISIQQQNSLSSAIANVSSAYSTVVSVPSPTFGTVNMANAGYLNFFMTNSVSTDRCYLVQFKAQAQP
jgi:hypothetical protein